VAKFINILAASVGGGILLGTGIRLGEAIVGGEPRATRDSEAGGRLETRLGALEDRLVSLEAAGSRTGDARQERQTGAVAAIRSELAREDERVAALSQIGAQLRVELQGWLEHSVGSRMADVEAKLRAESEDARRQVLDAFAESVHTRVTQRISRLEEEVAGQSAAMAELRDCSLRTEHSLQKLLCGLDRLLAPRPVPPPADSPSEEQAIGRNGEPPGSSPDIEPQPVPRQAREAESESRVGEALRDPENAGSAAETPAVGPLLMIHFGGQPG
jgi:hypothetical protein